MPYPSDYRSEGGDASDNSEGSRDPVIRLLSASRTAMLAYRNPPRLSTLPALVMPEIHVAAVPPREALLICPECGELLAAPAYEAHLRKAHRLVFFRGRHFAHADALGLLLNLVAAPTPDPDAWRVLATLARADHGQRADAFLAATLGGLLARVDGKRRGAAVEALATLLTTESDACLTAALSGESEIAARWLALAVMARLALAL